MIFEPAQHFERLQAVDSELFEEIVFGRERTRRHIKVLRRQIEDFLGGLLKRTHASLNLSSSRQERKLSGLLAEWNRPPYRGGPSPKVDAKEERGRGVFRGRPLPGAWTRPVCRGWRQHET